MRKPSLAPPKQSLDGAPRFVVNLVFESGVVVAFPAEVTGGFVNRL